MEKSKQIAILKELLSHLEAGTTTQTDSLRWNDASAYVSRDILKAEKEKLFKRQPLVAGLSCDLPEPGSYLAQKVAGVSYILIRGRDKKVRAFLNACRHRGSQLVPNDTNGRRGSFACPFHAWTYDFEGDLVAIPREGSVGALDRSCHSLVALPALERLGIIWIGLEPGSTISLDASLDRLEDELADLKLQSLYAREPRLLRRPMNWKLANDTFGETYHFEILHRKTLSATYHSNVTAYETFGRHHRMVFAARTIDALRTTPEDDWSLRQHSTLAYYLFPNTQLLAAPQYVSLYRIFPDDDRPDHCLIYQSIYLKREPASEEDRVNESRILQVHEDVIVNEDFVVAESAQPALSSGLIDRVMYARNEPALHHYHSTFREALGLGPLARAPSDM